MDKIRNRSRSTSTSANSATTKVSKVLKRVGDKVRVGVALFDDVAKSLAKATNHDKVPPKEKHVRKIIMATNGPSNELNFGELVDAMSRIVTQSKDWLVSLKGLQLFHRLVQEGSEEFVETVLRHHVSKVLNMSAWKDRSTAIAMEQSPFVRQYGRYVEERYVLYRNIQIKYLDKSTQLPVIGSVRGREEELFKTISSLQRVCEELIECSVLLAEKRSRLDNGATVGAFNLLLDDGLVLFKLLSGANLQLLDSYFDMDKPNAQKAYKLYEKHCRQSLGLLDFFKFAKKTGLSRRNIPALKSTPDSILEAMKEFLGGEVTDTARRAWAEVDHNFDDIEVDEVPTMNLSDLLSQQEMDFIQTTAANNSEDQSNKRLSRRSEANASPAMLEFDDFLPPPTNNQPSRSRASSGASKTNANNMINFDDFLTDAMASPSSPQVQQNMNVQYNGRSPQQQQYQPSPNANNRSSMTANPYYSAPQMVPPYQQQQQGWNTPPPQYSPQHQQQQPPPPYYNNNNPNMPPHMVNQMQKQQEVTQKQQFYRQQYLQAQQQPQQQQQQSPSSSNPFDDPF